MNITSAAFPHHGIIPEKYTCDSHDINPPLSLSEIPAKAKSLAIIMDDPDAPSGTWVHWLVWNIDPQIKEILECSVPKDGVQGMNSSGQNIYQGPCPPSGTHHYHFKLFALDTKLNLDSGRIKDDLEKAMQGHIIDQAELIGLYSRK